LSTFTSYGPTGGSWQLVGLENYRGALSDTGLRIAFGNGILLALLTVPIEAALGLVLAIALRRPFHGRTLVRVLLLAPWLVSPIAAGVMWHFLYNSQVGMVAWLAAWLRGDVSSPLADPRWSLLAVAGAEIWRMAPLASFLLLPGVLAIPQDDLDYATLAGSPPWTTLWVVIVPHIRVLLLTVLLLLAGQSLNTFDTILVLTGGGPGQNTVTPALYAYQMAVGAHNWPLGVASSWLLVGLVFAAGSIYFLSLRGEVV
jgi:multiple sugar transport system permease protein